MKRIGSCLLPLLVLAALVTTPSKVFSQDSTTASSWKLAVENQFTTNGGKVNIFLQNSLVEIYGLQTPGGLEIEAGPRVHLGLLTVTVRLGLIHRVSDNKLYSQAALNGFLKYGIIQILTVNEVSLEDLDNPQLAYQEGFILIASDGITSLLDNSHVGCSFEHYKKNGKQTWVVGPMFAHTWPKGLVQKFALWAGITQNPTAAVKITFKLPW